MIQGDCYIACAYAKYDWLIPDQVVLNKSLVPRRATKTKWRRKIIHSVDLFSNLLKDQVSSKKEAYTKRSKKCSRNLKQEKFSFVK